MSDDVTRRQMLGRAGLLIGGATAFGFLQACGGSSSDDSTPPITEPPVTEEGPQVSQFPYEQHLPAGYQLQSASTQEAAYHAYYNGGCCHGTYSALLGELAQTAGAPFNLLPLDFGKFGGGGVAGYGSLCGALLGSVLVVNMVVSNATARAAIMTDLMRWYEEYPFPAYVPVAKNAKEDTGVTLDFSAANLVQLQRSPRSHLCHASVSGWCAANGVSATGGDKLARCARLTADVAGKTVEMLNTYLSSSAYTARPRDEVSAACVSCHPGTIATKPVASGMECATCHADKLGSHF
jgi:hypothetical protein